MRFEELEDFKNDLRALLKKYKSLREDLLVLRKVLVVAPDERPPCSVRIEHSRIDARVIKIKMACKSLKGHGVSSGLELIYALFEKENRIVMMGLYHAGDKRRSEKKMGLRPF